MRIVFESDDFLAVDKPAGTLTIPSRRGADDPRTCLKLELERVRGERLWTVHRLDFEVSGLLIFARSAAAHRRASRVFQDRQLDKVYEAWTTGQAPKGELRLDSPLARGKKRSYPAPHGKPCLTIARVVERRGELLRWELHPHTGRSHQLRVHLSQGGWPILGDVLYGSDRPWAPGEIALRALSLRFHVPVQGLPEQLSIPPLETRNV